MVDQLLIAVFAWFHIFFAMSWLGPGLFFGFILTPVVDRLSPQFQSEFYQKIMYRTTSYFRIIPGFTLVFGVLLLYGLTNGDVSWLWSSPSGERVAVGMTLGLVAFLITNIISVPHFTKAARILRESQNADLQVLPVEFRNALRLGDVSAGISGIILLVVLIFMVGAGFY